MPNVTNNQSSLTITLLIYEQVLATSLTLPIEMLRAGEAFALKKNANALSLNIQLVSTHKEPIPSRAGIILMPDCDINNALNSDIIIVPSMWRNPRPVVRKHQALVSWLHSQWSAKSTIIGVGTGVCLLAASGILDNHPATTHWHYVEQFKRDYPNVKLKPDFFITQSEGIYCAASLNALADIVVHLLEQTYGIEAAHHVERNFSHEIRKPYEQQRYLEGAVDKHPDELIAQIQFWMRTNLNSEDNLSNIAAQFNISLRSLSRRFKAATGESAIQYWQKVRIEMAKDLLTSSNLSIQEIAFQVGYQDQGHLTRTFKKILQLTPKSYRSMVRKKLFSQE